MLWLSLSDTRAAASGNATPAGSLSTAVQRPRATSIWTITTRHAKGGCVPTPSTVCRDKYVCNDLIFTLFLIKNDHEFVRAGGRCLSASRFGSVAPSRVPLQLARATSGVPCSRLPRCVCVYLPMMVKSFYRIGVEHIFVSL